MGMARHRASILLLQGPELLPFLDGLSTNLVDGPCTTAFTNRAAKIIDVCEVIPVGENVALVGFHDHKKSLVEHLSQRILGRPITMSDISALNDVFIGNGEDDLPPDVTVHSSYFGTVYIVPIRHRWKASWTADEWTEYRIKHCLPYHGYEITSSVHPLACGLDDIVHPQKGCYVGQEVLTRMRSRGKQGHRLVVRDNPVHGATTAGREQSLCIERIQ